MSNQLPAPTAKEQQMDQIIQQLQSALGVHESKEAAAKQMIDELTTANVHLRAATFELHKQVNAVNNRAIQENKQHTDKHAHLQAQIDSMPKFATGTPEAELIDKNKALQIENDRLTKVVAVLDEKLSGLILAAKEHAEKQAAKMMGGNGDHPINNTAKAKDHK